MSNQQRCGALAPFTEQGSCTSQLTAAEVMDVMARLPDCAGQAADANHSSKNERRSEITEASKVRMSDIHDTSGPNLGLILKIPWFLLNEICLVTHLLDCCGKDNLKRILLGLGW